MRNIALVVPGGDEGLFVSREEISVEGAKLAAELGHEVTLVGDENSSVLQAVSNDFEIVHAPDYVRMNEDPAKAFRSERKQHLAQNIAAELLREGRVDAMVDCGNTGAAVAAGVLTVKRLIRGLTPAIPAPFPVIDLEQREIKGRTIMLDVGANINVNAKMLAGWAIAGSVFSQQSYGVEAPRVGLLNIGEEPGKGPEVTKEAFDLITAQQAASGINFVGNVEGRDLFNGEVDVVVTDGPTGNKMLKGAEGLATAVGLTIFGAFEVDDDTRQAKEVMSPHLRVLKEALDPNLVGGAILLGVNGILTIGHGSSSETAVANAIDFSAKAVDLEVLARTKAAIEAAKS